MQRVKTKTLLYFEHDDTCWVYDITYDHFCSLQQAKVICLPFVLSPKRGTLAYSEGRDELPQS